MGVTEVFEIQTFHPRSRTHTFVNKGRARDYDPVVGRWTAKDPIGFAGGDTNLYSYVGQNPVNLVDPVGLFGFQVGGGFSFFGGTFGGAAESGIAITYSEQFGLQMGGYQSGQVRAGAGIQAGAGINLTFTPSARQLSDLGGFNPSVGLESPLRLGSRGIGVSDINGRAAPSYSLGFGPSVGAAIYGGASYTSTGEALKFGGACK